MIVVGLKGVVAVVVPSRSRIMVAVSVVLGALSSGCVSPRSRLVVSPSFIGVILVLVRVTVPILEVIVRGVILLSQQVTEIEAIFLDW